MFQLFFLMVFGLSGDAHASKCYKIKKKPAREKCLKRERQQQAAKQQRAKKEAQRKKRAQQEAQRRRQQQEAQRRRQQQEAQKRKANRNRSVNKKRNNERVKAKAKKRNRQMNRAKRQKRANRQRRSNEVFVEKSYAPQRRSRKNVGIGLCAGLGAECLGIGAKLEYIAKPYGISLITNGVATGGIFRFYLAEGLHVLCGAHFFSPTQSISNSAIRGCGVGIDIRNSDGILRITGSANAGEVDAPALNGTLSIGYGAAVTYTYLLF